ncbi:hypothetical protein V6Z11_D10G220400 [Gossypium hirsutum]
MIELRKKNVEYETVSTELTASQSECQELKEKIRSIESTLQAHQQHLDDLLRALEEKNGQHDRDIRAYERALQEKDMHLGGLVNEIHKAAAQVVQLSDEVEVLSCQYPPNQKSSISEFLEPRAMDAELNERMEKMERTQRELQEQLAKSQQEARDLMVRSREESLEQKDQMAKMMEMMTALVRGKGPM